MHLSGPRALRSPAELLARRELLKTDAAIQPLRAWLAEMQARGGAIAPDFDPAEAGVNTRVLVLLEAPGPMTNADNLRPGSGFISVDNDDKTAENSWILRQEAGLLENTLHWNIVPWYLGPASKKPSAFELAQGAMELRRLLPLLPELRAVVLAGRYAQNGWFKYVAPFTGNALRVLPSWHPSPLSLNQPGHRDDLRQALASAATYV